MGPRLVTLDEIDYNELTMVARVNGQVVAEDTSSDLYHNFPNSIPEIFPALILPHMGLLKPRD